MLHCLVNKSPSLHENKLCRHNTRPGSGGSLVPFKQWGPHCCARAKPPIQAPYENNGAHFVRQLHSGSRASSEAPVGCVISPLAVCVLCLDKSHMLLLIEYVFRIKRTEQKRPQGMSQNHSKFITGSVYTLPFWLKLPNWRETLFPKAEKHTYWNRRPSVCGIVRHFGVCWLIWAKMINISSDSVDVRWGHFDIECT